MVGMCGEVFDFLDYSDVSGRYEGTHLRLMRTVLGYQEKGREQRLREKRTEAPLLLDSKETYVTGQNLKGSRAKGEKSWKHCLPSLACFGGRGDNT